jgi:hypothetical protein
MIIMTALCILRNTERSVITVTSNRYLACRSYRLFRELFRQMEDVPVTIDIEGGRVSFIVPEVLSTIERKEDYVFIVDKVDQECFAPIDRMDDDRRSPGASPDATLKRFCFKPSLHSEFHSMIGFSRSIGGAEEWDALKNLYDAPCLLQVPRLQNS